MDFVDGALTLPASWPIDIPAGMPLDEVARIVAAVASALDYAHKQRPASRDVKPANIMMTHVDDDGEVRTLLTDFRDSPQYQRHQRLTTTNMTVGTVAYCAPENFWVKSRRAS